MKIKTMREAIKSAYESKKWYRSVDQMPDRQIVAVYNSLVSQGKVRL